MIDTLSQRLKKIVFSLLGLVLTGMFILLGNGDARAEQQPKASIAVLSHTDFLRDATGVFYRRSWNGRDKNPAFAANNDLRTEKDQAYDKVNRDNGYDPEAVGLPEVLADAILEQLTKSKRFVPVERKTLRTAVLEQRFGKQITDSYLDRTLDKAIQDMDTFEIGGGLAMGATTAGAKYNDLLHDFKDLGSAIGANFLVLGNLHQLGSATASTSVPLSEDGRTVTKKTAESRLRLRVIDASSSTVVGADSLHLKVSSMLFQGGKESPNDFEFMERVAKEAANKILDIVFPAKVVSLEPMVISRGSNDGVAVGDEFSIVREGKEIQESSGAVIARLKNEVGTVRVTQVQETIAIVETEGSSDIISGDLAVRTVYEPPAPPAVAAVPLVPSKAAGNLPRVAIGLVKADSTAKTGPEAGKHVPLFTDTIITRLVGSRRFTVIDRQEVDQLLDEQMAQALAENRDLPSVMGALKGCDYLILGSLQNFSMEEQVIKLPNSSRVMKVLDGFAEGNIRLVDARSGDIMESRKITVEKQLEIQGGKERMSASLADDFAAEVVAVLLNSVYPIKIAAVLPDGDVYVNRGADGLLNSGTIFEVMQLGEKVLDPDTGVELGVIESRIGQIELLSVEENRSLGRITEGAEIKTGDKLKRVRDAGTVDENVAGKRSGGVLQGGAVSAQVERSGSVQPPKGKATLALVKITLNARQKFDDNSRISVVQDGTMDQLTDVMADGLAKTNRFALMERREVDQIVDEKAFQAVSQGGDIRDYLKELQGADYLVVGELTNFYLYIKKSKVPYLDVMQVDYTGFIEGNQRIVDGHTSEVIATDKIRIKRKFKNIGIEEIRTQLIDQYAFEAADGIVQRIYPMKVLGTLPDGTIYVNRGADAGLQTGATFTIERPGQDMIDKDTGVSFGAAETTVGVLEITDVEVARSRARLVEGEIPVAGDILRKERFPDVPEKEQKMKVSW
jgi:curli biogenesis system outer membrane secretion channel CsgG